MAQWKHGAVTDPQELELFCNMPSKRASMIAFAEEMSARGKPKRVIRWLREQVPIMGTKDFVSRIRTNHRSASEE